jgi:hypothetical protein
MVWKINIKNSFSDVHLNFFLTNLGGGSDEHRECFHQELSSVWCQNKSRASITDWLRRDIIKNDIKEKHKHVSSVATIKVSSTVTFYFHIFTVFKSAEI